MATSSASLPLNIYPSRSRLFYVGRHFQALQAVLDVLAILLAWQISISLRILLNPVMTIHLTRNLLKSMTPPIGGILILWVVAAWWLGVYKKSSVLSVGTTLIRIMESVAVLGVVTIVATFFLRQMGTELSRSFILLFLSVLFVTLLISRYIGLSAFVAVERRWPIMGRVAIIGDCRQAQEAIERISTFRPWALAGVVLPHGASPNLERASSAPLLGTTRALREVINFARLEQVIIFERHLDDAELQSCISIAKQMGVTVTRIIGLPERDTRAHLSELYGFQTIELRAVSFSRKQEFFKRTFDVLGSAILLLLLGPMLMVIAVLITATSKGPVLYRSQRVGRGGRHFTFLKFRTMHTGMEDRRGLESNNEKSGHIFKIRNDPRVTPLGRFLRRYSLDELPQLVNVLIGNMSLVGPRPLPASDLEPSGLSWAFHEWAGQRARVLPGVTGLWQIRGRSDLAFEKMVELDLEYIRDWSFSLDLRILLETPLMVISGRGAY